MSLLETGYVNDRTYHRALKSVVLRGMVAFGEAVQAWTPAPVRRLYLSIRQQLYQSSHAEYRDRRCDDEIAALYATRAALVRAYPRIEENTEEDYGRWVDDYDA